jgi:hypothetical protein
MERDYSSMPWMQPPQYNEPEAEDKPRRPIQSNHSPKAVNRGPVTDRLEDDDLEEFSSSRTRDPDSFASLDDTPIDYSRTAAKVGDEEFGVKDSDYTDMYNPPEE